MKIEKIYIHSEYITLGQFLKLTNLFDSGGMIKHYLQEQGVLVNNEKEHRRGRKLYEKDIVEVEGHSFTIVQEPT